MRMFSNSWVRARPSPRPRLCVCWPMAPVMKSMKSAMKSSGMTLSAVYSSVAETTGLKQKQARGVVEGIMGVAADQLKKNGAFSLPACSTGS